MAGEYRTYVAQLVRVWAIANLSIKLQRKPTEAEIARWIQSLLRGHERERLKAAADRARLLGGRIRTGRVGRMNETAPSAALMDHGWWQYASVVNGEFLSVFPRVGEVYGPWFGSSRLGEQYEEGGATKSVLMHRGAMYSGRMRELVQLLGGMRFPIEYSHRWEKTHGVYINALTGRWWIVEISDESGVVAWPAPIKAMLTETEAQSLGVTTPFVPGHDGTLAASPGARELLSPAGLDDFYTEAWSYTQEMGWAFSYDGSHAVNLSILAPNSDRYVNVWRVDIAADEDGNPVAAALVGVEHADIDFGLGFLPKYPYYIDGCGWTLLSFNGGAITQNSAPTNTATAGGAVGNCAMDAFYLDGDASPVIVRHFVDEAGVGTTTQEGGWPGGDDCFGWLAINLALINEMSTEDWSVTTSPKPQMEFDGIGRPAPAVRPESKTTDGDVVRQSFEATGPCFVGAYSGNPNDHRIYTESYIGRSTRLKNGGGTTVEYSEVFFKPLFDREGVGLHRIFREVNDYDGGFEDYQADGIFGGEYLTGPIYSDLGYFYKEANPQCTHNFGAWTSAAGVLSRAGFPTMVPSAEGDELAYRAPWCPPDNVAYRLTWPPGGWAPSGPCRLVDSGVTGGDSSTESETSTYLYNGKERTWYLVRTDAVFSAADPMIATKLSCAPDGPLLFCSYLDVFTGEGASYKVANDGNDLSFIGAAGTKYPIDDSMQLTYSGWVGVPLPP